MEYTEMGAEAQVPRGQISLLESIDFRELSEERLRWLLDKAKEEVSIRRHNAGLARWAASKTAKEQLEDEQEVALAQEFGESEGVDLFHGINPGYDYGDRTPGRKDRCWRSRATYAPVDQDTVDALIVRFLKRKDVPPSTNKVGAVRRQARLLLQF